MSRLGKLANILLLAGISSLLAVGCSQSSLPSAPVQPLQSITQAQAEQTNQTTQNENSNPNKKSSDTATFPHTYTMDDAIELVATLYYNGSKNDLYANEIKPNVYVVKLAKDFGSGLLTNVDAFLVDNGKIVDSLMGQKTGVNSNFWHNVDTYRSGVNNTNSSSSTLENQYNLTDLQNNGLRVIEDQSFWIQLENWGKVRFVSGKSRVAGRSKLDFYLVDDNGKVLYKFPDFYGNKWPWFEGIRAVSFQDVNKDGLTDIIVSAEYSTGAGPQGAIPFPIGGIYYQKNREFVSMPELDKQINEAGKNKSIEMLLKFAEGKDLKLTR